MLDSFRAFRRAFTHLNHRGYIYIWANVLWFALSLPIITAPAAWAGLVRMSHRAHIGPTADIHDFLEGFKENLGRGFVLTLLNAFIILLNISNLTAYRQESGLLFDVLRFVWILILFIWFSIQFYLWPLFYEMKQPSLWGAFRNASVMFLLNPFFTIGVWIVILLVLVFSILLVAPWILLTGGVIAAFATTAVLNRLEVAGIRQPLPEYVSNEKDPVL